MAILRTGQMFQSEDGERLYTVVQGIPRLPIAGVGLGSSQAVLPFPPVPSCLYELCLEDGQAEVSHLEVTLECREAQNVPHNFETYAEQAFQAHYAGLGGRKPAPWSCIPHDIKQAWRAVAVRITRLATHTLAAQVDEKERV